ncbi:hypothetical protein FB451DRAFT_1236432 [Mycena latifolia]|nr:hypothetical protein FB451DRAFT_1236432 [Mycena latifolia]
MSRLVDTLPFELLADLPHFSHSIEELLSLSSTCRTLYRACANPVPKEVLRLAAGSGRIFFRPHPHILIAATARQVADWAVQDDDRRYQLELAIHGGVDKLLELALDVAGLTMDDIRRLHAYKCDVLNLLNRRLDLAAGPATGRPWTVCNDPETTLLSWIIYGELFHHSLELAYLPLPKHKPLSSIIRYKWFVYCMPDVNSFNYMEFPRDGSETPEFFKQYIQDDDDRFQQLSMAEAMRELLDPSLWKGELGPLPVAAESELHDPYISSVMHMGMKSLEVLVPGGPEKSKEDLERVANGLAALHDGQNPDPEERLREFVGDPWLWTPFITLQTDLSFTLWANWMGDEDDFDPLMEAIRKPPQKKVN